MLILARHGTTDWNELGLIRGTVDIPLNDSGRQAISELAGRISKEFVNVDLVMSDYLSRCQETAQIIADACRSVTCVNNNLMPWPIGKLAGQMKEDIIDSIKHYVETPTLVVPGGTSYWNFYSRWKNEFLRLKSIYGGHDDRSAVAIVHSSNFHALPSIELGQGPSYAPEHEPLPGEMVVF